jgi:hypothetical protein
MEGAGRFSAVAALVLVLSGCGLESKSPNIWLQNDSDQTVVLQMRARTGPAFAVTAKPHLREWSAGSPPKGLCYIDWEIVDTSGKVLKQVERVCAYDTVVYP